MSQSRAISVGDTWCRRDINQRIRTWVLANKNLFMKALTKVHGSQSKGGSKISGLIPVKLKMKLTGKAQRILEKKAEQFNKPDL